MTITLCIIAFWLAVLATRQNLELARLRRRHIHNAPEGPSPTRGYGPNVLAYTLPRHVESVYAMLMNQPDFPDGARLAGVMITRNGALVIRIEVPHD